MKTIGLTLGKFAPLHLGHQYVIETALNEMEKVIVIIYESGEVTSIPLSIRSGWISKLYPEVEVIEGWKGPSCMGDTDDIKKIQEDYVLCLLKDRQITHFYSSEFYGLHMSKALGAVNRVVDEHRHKFPVSATAIRNDPFGHKQYISPVVYKDLITHIVFLGAPSTGKTTIAAALAQEFETKWMPEYGREYWENNQVDRKLTPEQLVEIAEAHREREERLIVQANQYLFTDTNALTTYRFSLYYHGLAEERLAQLAAEAEKRYDLVFLCDDDIPYDDTWDRSGAANRADFQQKIKEDLQARNVPFILLSGNPEQRKKKVKEVLASFDKYGHSRKL